jgi:hypothetical protein
MGKHVFRGKIASMFAHLERESDGEKHSVDTNHEIVRKVFSELLLNYNVIFMPSTIKVGKNQTFK